MDLAKQEWGISSESALLLDKKRGKKVSQQSSFLRCFIYIGLAAFVLVACVVALSLALALTLTLSQDDPSGYTESYQHAAVATDAAQCSEIGANLLKNGGNAVDAAVASLFCVGVINLQSAGIGGGGFLIIYNATTQETTAIDFREKAPAIISESTMQEYINNPESTLKGGLAIGVPGQVKGLYEAHQRFGRLPWPDVIRPAIAVAHDGFIVTSAVGRAIQAVQNDLKNGNYTGLSQLINPSGQPLQEGDLLQQPELANTLESIAQFGPDYFYSSDFTQEMVDELTNQYGSILTVDDFHTYEAVTREILMSDYNNLQIHSFPPPSSGAVLALIFNILEGYNFTDLSALTYHRIVEAFKFAYGQRLDLGDPDFNETIEKVVEYMMNTETAQTMYSRISDDTTHNVDYYLQHGPEYEPDTHGTTHLSVIDEDGNAVGITSTINTFFGSLVRSVKSGIIFNNEMDDFSVPGRNNSYGYPPSPSNYLRPSRRPLSSMTPTIVTRNGEVVMVAGAAGGSMIPTATSQVLLDVLSFSLSLDEAVSRSRLHHQLIPNYVRIESDFPANYVEGLETRNHRIFRTANIAVVQAIYKDEDGTIFAASDRRKGGSPSGY